MPALPFTYADEERPARDLTSRGSSRQSYRRMREDRTVNYVAAYRLEELLEDARRRARGEPLSCPSCGWTDPPDREPRLFDVYLEKAIHGGLGYSYRLCKVCGFAQDADGGESYRVWLSVHECRPRDAGAGASAYDCRHCSRSYPVADGVPVPHRCGKYLRQGDIGYCCATFFAR